MRFGAFALSAAACIVSFAVNADTVLGGKSQQNDINQGGVYLDQSQDIFFDALPLSTFSLDVLKAKNKFNNHALIFGGSLEIDLQRWQGNQIETIPPGIYQTGKGVYFTLASLDMMANVTPWITAFISVLDAHIGRAGPGTNTLNLPNDFILLGNLNEAPVYVTLGLSNIPFGTFTGTGIWDVPLTSDYFNPSTAPQISLGYYKNGWHAVATEFSDETNHENNFAGRFYYDKTVDNLSYSFGISTLTDLKSNSTGNVSNNLDNVRDLPELDLGAVWDLNGNVVYRQVGFMLEYVRGNAKVLTNHDRPTAIAMIATYTPVIAGKDTVFALSHSMTYGLKDVPTSLSGEDELPITASGLQSAWAFSVMRKVFAKNITLGLDLEKSTTYSAKNTYTSTLEMIVYL